jgi:hypothetical protein
VVFHKIFTLLGKILTDDGAVINIPEEKSDEKSPFIGAGLGLLMGRYLVGLGSLRQVSFFFIILVC